MAGSLLFAFGAVPLAGAEAAPRNEFIVTTAADAGKGSLREALLKANALSGPHLIRFDSKTGFFGSPKTIRLRRALPELTGEIILDGYIEGRLWQATGVTLSGDHKYPVLSVAPGARVTLSALTLADGRAKQGAGVLNRGNLVVKGVTLSGNNASRDGGGIANLGGTVTVVNSTFVENRAGDAGGGFANDGGHATVTNTTFSGNAARKGSGLFSAGALLLRNSILANSKEGQDCAAEGDFDPASTHNLIESHLGCGEPISTADPRFESLGLYNGPTATLPPGGGSPAINLGDNAAALDEHGQPLVWDQRGNGDPRLVAGITDIGAFEVQAFPVLKVNTLDDTELRACTGVGVGDCSLRGAITLANAMSKPATITFEPTVFAAPQILTLIRPLPEVTADMTLDARGTGGVTLRSQSENPKTGPGGKLTLHAVKLETSH